jgi:opacity protein-like surface antigen
MKKFAAAVTLGLAALVSVSAAKAQTATSPSLDFFTAPPAYSWNGAYAGLQMGRSVLDSPGGQESAFQPPSGMLQTVSPTLQMGTGDDDANVSGGVTVGYGRQFGRAVLGLEGTGSAAADQTNQGCGTFASAAFLPGTVADCSTGLRYFATMDARVGYAFGRLLPYVKGGGAWGDFHHDVSGTLPAGAPAPASSFNESRWGYNVGGGLEYRIASGWSVNFEYDYMDFGTKNLAYPFNNTPPFLPGTFTAYASDTEKVTTMRLGVNYHF